MNLRFVAQQSTACLPKKPASKNVVTMFTITDLVTKISVPIFDARYKQIKLPHGIRDVPKNFPLFKEQVPDDAVILIGYSTAAYNSKRTPNDTSVSLNIVWAAVLASADP